MKGDAGFTLVEVLAASAVLLVVLLGGAAMTLTAYQNLLQSGEHTTAAELLQQHLEWLRNQGYTSAELSAGTTSTGLGGDFAGYTRTTTVADATPVAGVKQVTVILTMPSGFSVQSSTLIVE